MRASRRGRIAAALAIGVSGPGVAALVWQHQLALAFGLHVVAAFAAWRLWRRPGEGGKMIGIQAATLAGAFPVVGGPMAMLIFGHEGASSDELLSSYRDYIAYRQDKARWLRPIGNHEAAVLREVSVRPLVDQLRHGDLVAKQSAADALRRMPGPSGVAVLRQALAHPAEDTRLLASLALVKLEEQLSLALADARAARSREPGGVEEARGVAEAARRYAESGLPALPAELWRECAEAYDRVAASGDATAGELMALARARQALKEPYEALSAAEKALALSAGDVDAGVLHLELLWGIGRMDALATAAARLLRHTTVGSEAHEIASFWAPAPMGQAV